MHWTRRIIERVFTSILLIMWYFPRQEAELSDSKQRRIEEVGELRSKLEDRSKAVEVLSQQIEDQRDENKTLKRRHAANIKVRQRRRYTAV